MAKTDSPPVLSTINISLPWGASYPAGSAVRVDYSIDACPHRGDTVDMYMGVVGPGMAYYVDENFNLSTTPVPYVDNLQNLQDLSGGFTFTIPHLAPEGNYVIRAVITDPDDRFDEYSNVGSSPTFFVDVVAPTVTLYMNSSQYYPGSWVDVDYSINPGTYGGTQVNVYLKLRFPSGQSWYVNSSGQLELNAVPYVNDMQLPYSPTGRVDLWGFSAGYGLQPGQYLFSGQLYRTGEGPLSNAAEAPFTFVNPPPHIVSVTGVPGTVEPGNSVTPSFTADKPVIRGQLWWNGNFIREGGFPPSPGPHSDTFTIPEVPDGYYPITIKTMDEANQWGETSVTTHVHIDTTPPTIIVDAPGSVVQGQTFTVSMSTNEYVTWIQIRFNGNIILDTGVAGTGPWPTSPTTGAHWPEGTYWFDFYARDPRGNTGYLSRSIFLDDVVPPEITSVDVPSSNLFHWGDTIRLTGHFNEPINRVHKWIEGTGLNYEYDVNPSDAHTVEYTIPSNAPSGWYTARFAVRDTGYNWTETGGYFFHVVP